MITIIYNEGLGFTEYKKKYKDLKIAIKKEGSKIIEAHIYKNNKRIQ